MRGKRNPETERKIAAILRMPDKPKVTPVQRFAIKALPILARLDNNLNMAINAGR